MPEFSSQLEEPFVRFDAAVAEETFSRTDQPHQRLRQPALRFVVIKVRAMNELARLLEQHFGNCRMCVAKRADSDAAAKVQVAFAAGVIHVAASTMAQPD